VRKTRSILEELNQISIDRDRDHVVENRGDHVINSAIHLIEQIEAYYDEDTAKDLSNRLINSIKGRDPAKFSRGIKKVIKEAQREQDEDL
jgi:predicted metal-dependent peptidase